MNGYAEEGKKLLNQICSPGFKKGGININDEIWKLFFGKW
jgi:hypothetical protein